MFGSWGRFSGVRSASRWVSFMLKSFGDCAPAIPVAIVPNKGGWTAIASRNDRNHHPRCAKRIEEVQSELRELYVLAKD